MVRWLGLPGLVLLFLQSAPAAQAQAPGLERLPSAVLPVTPPSARVNGEPGALRVSAASCPAPVVTPVRQRLVDIAVQEWAFFGFRVVDPFEVEEEPTGGAPRPRRRPRLDPVEAARVAESIAGYWSATSDGAWIIERQNSAWQGPDGIAARWQYPWSAAFVSWVMCEGGLGGQAQFRRAVAHHVYIDQAIRVRDAAGSGAYTAFDVGERAVEPGDLLCSARRPSYDSLAERRQQMGAGARTHCDIVVKVEAASGRIYAIGGNVRASVALKMLPAATVGAITSPTRPATGTRGRPIFAHLKLGAPAGADDALGQTPTMQALACRQPAFRMPAQVALVDISIPRPISCQAE